MPNWTDEQKQAIYSKGQDTLVSAAAGSGKTAVLVERIIQKIVDMESPVNIDELMVATFTNAAAQEMRNRVQAALEAALEKNPNSTHLKKQTTLLQQAQISTLHSFCLDLIKRYSYNIDIDPGFRIANDLEADLLRQEVLSDLFEYWYSDEYERQQAFFDVVDRFSGDRNDVGVETLILKLYDFAMKNPWPELWLNQLKRAYNFEEKDMKDQPWFTFIQEIIQETLDQALEDLEKALALTRLPAGPYHYADLLSDEIAMIQSLRAQHELGFDTLAEAMDSLTFKRLPNKKSDADEQLKKEAQGYRNQAKKRLTELKDQFFSRDLAHHRQDLFDMAPIVDVVVELVIGFKMAYQAIKKEKGLVDFTDLEHFALTILVDPTDDGFNKTEIAEQLTRKYQEVLIDEYQDTNMVQETILRAITTEEPGNLFMVGDVKQSIYRFRHAEPSLFLAKYKAYQSETHHGLRIDLAKNFRSRKEVLNATNFIFQQLLDEAVGEMNYDKASELVYGNTTYDQALRDDLETEVLIVDRKQEEGSNVSDEDDLKKAELEARIYAKKIRHWMGESTGEKAVIFDKDSGEKRPCHYRDIVILLRSMTSAPTILETLKQQGIPVYAELDTGYLEAIEIKVMLSLLKIIDNTKQDIPFVSVLKSPMVGLNEQELAEIRLINQKASFYDALKSYCLEGENNLLINKIQSFVAQLNEWKSKNRTMDLSSLIWQIYRDTGYYDFVSGMPGGRQRQANLRALYDRARSYEETSFRGLYRFLRMIERMEERGEDLGAARALGEKEDVVRITTIHKSKGLEYPIVIVGAMDKQFNLMDLNAKYLLHKDYGFAMKHIDPEKRITYPTLMVKAFREYMKREQWAEEMRILYVALTRAKEKLLLVGTIKDLDQKLKKLSDVVHHTGVVLPAISRLEAHSYLDWIILALLRHKDGYALRDRIESENPNLIDHPSVFNVHLEHMTQYHEPLETLTNEKKDLEAIINHEALLNLSDDDKKAFVSNRLTFHYQHEKATTYQAKQTVTELKRRLIEPDVYTGNALIRNFKPTNKERPAFLKEVTTLSKAELGTAMHTVMQHIDFRKEWNPDKVKGFIDELAVRELLTEHQARAIEPEKILGFLKHAIVRLINEADTVEREVPFSIMLEGNKVYPEWTESDESVYLQGIIDLLIKKDGEWYLFDYKSDSVSSNPSGKMEKDLSNRYQIQIDLYTEAIETILNVKIKKRYLYFFDPQWLIEL